MRTIRRLTSILMAGILLSVCVGQGENEQAKVKRERMYWVEKCLMDFQSIKAGMTRGEIEQKFKMDGGLQTVSPVRYTHPECDYFKIDVEFDFKLNEKDQNRAIKSPEDKVTKILKPYIERPFID